jgi:hemerythrin-like domain-containing protein/GNAT superfamily N-acetyltransferase
MKLQAEVRSVPVFTVEAMEACDTQATRLWHDLHGPNCAGTRPAQCLVAREDQTSRLLGIAQYFRTFPPEDGCGAVLVVPEAVHGAVGRQLLETMAEQALHDGIRNLGTLVGKHDAATMDMLRAAGMPVRVSPLNDDLYIEMDLVTFAHLPGRKPGVPRRQPHPINSARPSPPAPQRRADMEATTTLRTEHNAVLYVLDQLDQAAAAAAAGQAVPREVFSDIEEVFRVFVDRCHHAKEETVLFPLLASTGLPQTLEAEHAQGRQLAQAYAGMVALYAPGDSTSGTALQRAAAGYAAMLRGHIARETAELLPAIERELAAQDEALVEAFEQIETERIGAGTHERLHGMIETLAGRISPYAAAVGRDPADRSLRRPTGVAVS